MYDNLGLTLIYKNNDRKNQRKLIDSKNVFLVNTSVFFG